MSGISMALSSPVRQNGYGWLRRTASMSRIRAIRIAFSASANVRPNCSWSCRAIDRRRLRWPDSNHSIASSIVLLLFGGFGNRSRSGSGIADAPHYAALRFLGGFGSREDHSFGGTNGLMQVFEGLLGLLLLLDQLRQC